MTNRKRPTGALYVIPALLLIAGGISSCVAGIAGAVEAVPAMKRVVVPGTGTVELEAGEQALYHEWRSRVDGKIYDYQGSLSELECRLMTEAGESLPLGGDMINSRYEGGSYAGEQVFEVKVPKSGRYTLDCALDGGPTVIAIGPSMGKMAKSAFMAFPWHSMLLCGLAALSWLAIFWSRSR